MQKTVLVLVLFLFLFFSVEGGGGWYQFMRYYYSNSSNCLPVAGYTNVHSSCAINGSIGPGIQISCLCNRTTNEIVLVGWNTTGTLNVIWWEIERHKLGVCHRGLWGEGNGTIIVASASDECGPTFGDVLAYGRPIDVWHSGSPTWPQGGAAPARLLPPVTLFAVLLCVLLLFVFRGEM